MTLTMTLTAMSSLVVTVHCLLRGPVVREASEVVVVLLSLALVMVLLHGPIRCPLHWHAEWLLPRPGSVSGQQQQQQQVHQRQQKQRPERASSSLLGTWPVHGLPVPQGLSALAPEAVDAMAWLSSA